MFIWDLLRAIPWYGWIAIVAVLAWSVESIAKAVLKHRERMEMIRHGIDPRKRTGE